MKEEKKKRSEGITAKIEEIFDEGDRMREETGKKTPKQKLKEASIIGGLTLTGAGGMGVMIGVDNYVHPKQTLNPDSSHEVILPDGPVHMKPAETLIEDFKNRKGEGFAGTIEAEKQSPSDKAR